MKLKDVPTKTAPPGSEERTSVGVYVDDYVLGVIENDDRTLIAESAEPHSMPSIQYSPSRSIWSHRRKGSDIEKEIRERRLPLRHRKGNVGIPYQWRRPNGKALRAQSQIVSGRYNRAPEEESCPLEEISFRLGYTPTCCSHYSRSQRAVPSTEQSNRRRSSTARSWKESEVHAALVDLRLNVLSLASRPTHVSEFVEYEPDLAGTFVSKRKADELRSGSQVCSFNIWWQSNFAP